MGAPCTFCRPKDVLDLERMVGFRKSQLDRLVDMVGDEDVRVREWDRIVAAYGGS